MWKEKNQKISRSQSMWLNKRERERGREQKKKQFYVCIKHKILEMERDNIKRNTKQNQMKSYKPNNLECSDGMKQRTWKKKWNWQRFENQNAKCKIPTVNYFKVNLIWHSVQNQKMLTDDGRLIVSEQSVIAKSNGRLLHSYSM